jgi:hypothetical protein
VDRLTAEEIDRLFTAAYEKSARQGLTLTNPLLLAGLVNGEAYNATQQKNSTCGIADRVGLSISDVQPTRGNRQLFGHSRHEYL